MEVVLWKMVCLCISSEHGGGVQTIVWRQCGGGWHGRSPWKRECLLVLCAAGSQLRARPSRQSRLSYLLLFFVICVRFAASGKQQLLRNMKLQDTKETDVYQKTFIILFLLLKCTWSTWLATSCKLLFHYRPPRKIGCDLVTWVEDREHYT